MIKSNFPIHWLLHVFFSFVDSTCLELGAGTGLCSILAGMFCKLIFCTGMLRVPCINASK